MSTPGRHIMLAFGLPLLILLLGGAILIWPAWQEQKELQLEIDDLNQRMAGISDQTEVVAILASRLDEARDILENDLKEIGTDANIADIIAHLSFPQDGINVIDQSNNRGSTRPATEDEDETLMAMALTIDMDATFESIYAAIRAAESMPRLVRITSVRLSPRPGAPDVPGSPIINASISLDSIYEPISREMN